MINDFMYQYKVKTNKAMAVLIGTTEGSVRKWRGGGKVPAYIENFLINEVKIRQAIAAETLEDCKDILKGKEFYTAKI